MVVSIRTDLGVSKTLFGLNRNLNDTYVALERLATGKRINYAKDDPAGLVISKQLQSQIATLNQEIENLSANIGKYQTVSASVMELRDGLTELRSLAVGAANGAYNDEDVQAAYATAAESIVHSYNRTIANAHYNGVPTLDGSEASLASVLELQGIDLSSPEAAAASLEKIDASASELDQIMIDLGATQKHDLESRRQSLEITRQNLQAAESAVTDADYAMEMSRFTAGLIRTQASLALLGHSFMTSKSALSLLSL
jgi:flagellin